MKSVTTELSKYLTREGIAHVGDPYIEFNEHSLGGRLGFKGSSTSFVPIFGFITLYRFSNIRWLVQWFQLGADRKPPEVRSKEVIELLEQVLKENRRGVQ